MEYNRVLGEEMEHKTPSPNVVTKGKTLSPNVIVREEKKMREIEEIDKGKRRRVLLKF